MMLPRTVPLAILPLLMACAAGDGTAAPPPPPPTAGASVIAPALEGSRWQVTEVAGKPVQRTTLEFKEGRIFGSGGCNRYTGGIAATAGGSFSAGAFEGGQMAMTMMACPEPQMAGEQAFMQALADARTWSLAGKDRLELKSGKDVLVRASRIKAD